MTQQESRDEARKRAEVMIAYSQGKKIEYCHPTLKEWAPVCAPLWDWSSTEYRVAAENINQKPATE